MKVSLISAPRGEKILGEMFKKLFEEVERLGYKHTSKLMMETSDDFESKMTTKKDAQVMFYNEMIESIHAADLCIFEATTPSSGVGYLIEKALANSKPTIVLFYKEYQSHLLTGIIDEKLIVKTYDEKNYKKVIKESIEVGKERRDKRFNFFLSPKLLDYLESESKQDGITKSKFIRDLIVEHMRTKTNEVIE